MPNPSASDLFSVKDVVILVLAMILIGGVILVILLIREKRKINKWLKRFDDLTGKDDK